MAELAVVSIVVEDMGAALEFYRLLGLEISPGEDEEPHVETITSRGMRITWDTLELIQSIHEDWTEPEGHRMVLAFECSSPGEVDKLYQQVVEAGHQGYKAPWDAFWGQRYAVVKDPAGNLVDLFAGV